jgi:hypothetical protein
MAKEIATIENSAEIIPFEDKPDWLPQDASNKGMEGIGKDDVKTPTIVLLQALSPQIKTFQGLAFPGDFWHTGMNVSLGNSFDFVTAIVSKRVIVFRPRDDQGGGILALSRDGRTWATGANQEYRVKLKGRKEPVIWSTGKDVLSSGLTEFGTSDPDDEQSPPAAMISYEYLVNLIKHPELSPVVIRAAKTALPNGKTLNTSLLTLSRAGKPIQSVVIRCFAEIKKNDLGEWAVPNFKTMGYAQKDIYKRTLEIAENFGDYNVDYSQEDENSNGSTSKEINDEINY